MGAKNEFDLITAYNHLKKKKEKRPFNVLKGTTI